MFVRKLTLYAAALRMALMTVFAHAAVVLMMFYMCGRGFGPLSFVTVTLLKVFVSSGGRDTKELKRKAHNLQIKHIMCQNIED